MVPTVTDNLYNLGFLPENKIAIFLNPLVITSADAIGEIAWGMSEFCDISLFIYSKF